MTDFLGQINTTAVYIKKKCVLHMSYFDIHNLGVKPQGGESKLVQFHAVVMF